MGSLTDWKSQTTLGELKSERMLTPHVLFEIELRQLGVSEFARSYKNVRRKAKGRVGPQTPWNVNRRRKRTPYRRGKGTPFLRALSGEKRSPCDAQRIAAFI